LATGSLIDDAKTIGFHRKLTLYSSGAPFIDAYVLSIIGVALTRTCHSLDRPSRA
jgi:MFS transporter, putative metabolite transport protein